MGDTYEELQKEIDELRARVGKALGPAALPKLSVQNSTLVMPGREGKHHGAGAYPGNRWQVIDPGTVPGTGQLRPTFVTADLRCYFFETTDVSVLRPTHFAAAASPSMTDFSNANIFFHPNPDRADPPMKEDDYPNAGGWLDLFRYAPNMGVQLSASHKNQVFIMPFIPGRLFGTTGSFAANWQTFCKDICKLVKNDITGSFDDTLELKNVVVSSFSYGIEASAGFRSNAVNLSGLLREIWDLDGMYSTSKQLSIDLRNKPLPALIQYQQALPTLARSFQVNPARWTDIDPTLKKLMATNPKAAGKEVHGNIGKALFYHACTLSAVG